jgi:hypothetical protein
MESNLELREERYAATRKAREPLSTALIVESEADENAPLRPSKLDVLSMLRNWIQHNEMIKARVTRTLKS